MEEKVVEELVDEIVEELNVINGLQTTVNEDSLEDLLDEEVVVENVSD